MRSLLMDNQAPFHFSAGINFPPATRALWQTPVRVHHELVDKLTQAHRLMVDLIRRPPGTGPNTESWDKVQAYMGKTGAHYLAVELSKPLSVTANLLRTTLFLARRGRGTLSFRARRALARHSRCLCSSPWCSWPRRRRAFYGRQA